MRKYKNTARNSGVEYFDIGDDFIVVQFNNKPLPYLNTYATAGPFHIEQMKLLARIGKGLSGYISKPVKDNYKEIIK